jgi:phospholipase/lecithinase/hemolysin
MKSMENSSKRGATHRAWKRAAQTAIAGAAFALLAACGGGGSSNSSSAASATPPGGVSLKTVSFGDSLSDVGTYALATTQFAGGRFTTNPGQVWTQDVANYYGDTLTPAVTGGLGAPTQAAGGLGFAQGGARVALTPGIGAPTLTALPITTQIQNYLTQYGSFNANQLVLIQGGPNDIFTQVQIAAAAGNTGAALLAAQNAVITAGATLATAIQAILNAGATKVVVVNVPDLGGTPQALAAGTQAQTLLSGLSTAFNAALKGQLQALGILSKVIYVDAFTWQDTLAANFAANGFSVGNTGTGCNLTLMQSRAQAYATANPAVLSPGETPAQFGASLASSLFCSPEMYTTANADQTYMFADGVHPTTHLHQLFAQFVEQQIAAAGIGK